MSQYGLLIDYKTEKIKALFQDEPSAYQEINQVLEKYGFVEISNNVFTSNKQSIVELVLAVQQLNNECLWLRTCINNISSFRIEEFTDLEILFKTE